MNRLSSIGWIGVELCMVALTTYSVMVCQSRQAEKHGCHEVTVPGPPKLDSFDGPQALSDEELLNQIRKERDEAEWKRHCGPPPCGYVSGRGYDGGQPNRYGDLHRGN